MQYEPGDTGDGNASLFVRRHKTKRRLQDKKTEHFRAFTSNSHSSAIADHMTQTGHGIKWDHFDILATRLSLLHCKIKETLLIRDLNQHLMKMLAVRNFSTSHLYFFKQI